MSSSRDQQRVRQAIFLPLLVVLTAFGCDQAVFKNVGVTAIAPPEVKLRRPIAIAVQDNGWLLVANRDAGSIQLVDPIVGMTQLSETVVGERLADLVATKTPNVFAAVDESTNELLLIENSDLNIEVVGRLKLDQSPVSIELSTDGQTAIVACLWAHRLAFVDISTPTSPQLLDKLDLDFAPRSQRALDDGKHLVVASSFDGRLALVDLEKRKVVKTRVWNAHNLRGIGVSADRRTLLIPHQALMSDYPTTDSGVHWGSVMMNLVRTVPVESLFKEPAPITADLAYLGDENDAAGDPTDFVVTKDDRRIVAFAGTSEVAISASAGGDDYVRIPVGARPTALALSPGEDQLYVANTFADSISIIDVAAGVVLEEVSLGPQPELDVAQQGELLFHDASLSRDSWFSCYSCHTDGHSNGLLNDNFGDGSTGAPKRVLSLLSVGDTQPWAWNGKVTELEEQVRKSVATTMRGKPLDEESVTALTAYLRSLPAAPSLAAARGDIDKALVDKGRQVFADNNCLDCHQKPNYTSTDNYDVGMQDEVGNKIFNPPSLLGVSQRPTLFHDNRAGSLRDAFETHKHALDEALSKADLDALLAFLNSL